jgi:hypothetical protein
VTRLNGGDGSISIAYTYAAPTVTSLTPSSGSMVGGSPVTIAGSGFLAGVTVTLGGAACASVSVVSSTQMTCTTGSHAAGAVNVVVTNIDTQTATRSNGYTYNLVAQAALIGSASPTSMRVNESGMLSTTGGSGTGVVTYALSSGPCTLSGSTLSGYGVGTCTVTATKAADSNYSSATATVTVTVSTARYLTTPALTVGVAGNNLSVLNLGGGDGPAMTNCLRDALQAVIGADAVYQGQTADGGARIGQTGQIVSFYALDVSSGNSPSQGTGIHLGATNPLNVVTSCGTFLTTPAMYNLADFGALLSTMGLTVQINQQGVMTASAGGIVYVVRPDYLVSQGTAGAPSLVMGADGLLRFTDSGGHIQILYPAFLDSATLGNQVAQAFNGSIVIQTDGTAIVTLLDGTPYLLTPDLTLGAIPSEQSGAMWWQDGANRYRYRTTSIFNTSQGFTVKALRR